MAVLGLRYGDYSTAREENQENIGGDRTMPAVKAYTYKRNGKTIHVKGHLRKRRTEQRGGVGVPLNKIVALIN